MDLVRSILNKRTALPLNRVTILPHSMDMLPSPIRSRDRCTCNSNLLEAMGQVV